LYISETGKVEGVFETVMETTKKVFGERRIKLLQGKNIKKSNQRVNKRGWEKQLLARIRKNLRKLWDCLIE